MIQSIHFKVTESNLVPSEVETNLRHEASINNEPTFNKIAYKIESEKDKSHYRRALAEYFCNIS